MEIVYSRDGLADYLRREAGRGRRAIFLDRFLENATEVDVDALCDGHEVWIGGIMQHVEEAGVHSGDSACVLPPHSLGEEMLEQIRSATRDIALGIGVVGLINVQYAVHDGRLFVIEANPRASRTVPFVSKAVGVPLAKLACRIMLGERIAELDLPAGHEGVGFGDHVSVKEAVLPFDRFDGADSLLGPEMRSTGEVMGIARDFPTAFAKAQAAAGSPLPSAGTAFISVTDSDKPGAFAVAQTLHDNGFRIIATRGTAEAIARMGVPARPINKIGEGSPHVVDWIERGRRRVDRQHPHGLGSAHATAGRSAAPRSPTPSPASPRSPRASRRRARSPRRSSWASPRCSRYRSSTVLAPFERRLLSVTANESLGAYRVLKAADPGGPGGRAPDPGQFAMLAAAERWGAGEDERPYLPRAFSYARFLDGEAHFLLEDVGPGTRRLCELRAGEGLWLLGPLGTGFTEPRDARRALLVGGGVGIAPLAILRDRLDGAATVLLGFRDRAHAEGATLLDDTAPTTDDGSTGHNRLATDDGSAGHHGPVTDLLAAELDRDAHAAVYACGPPAMLEAVRALCAERSVPAQLALEAGMACGFGACFGCVVPTREGYARVCVDGPVFDAERLDRVGESAGAPV